MDILETKSTEPNKNEIKVYYNNIDPYSSFSPKKKFSLTSKISKNLNFLKTNNELLIMNRNNQKDGNRISNNKCEKGRNVKFRQDKFVEVINIENWKQYNILNDNENENDDKEECSCNCIIF